MFLQTEKIASIIKALALQAQGPTLDIQKSHRKAGMVALVYDLLTAKAGAGRCWGFSGQLVCCTCSITMTDPVSKIRWWLLRMTLRLTSDLHTPYTPPHTQKYARAHVVTHKLGAVRLLICSKLYAICLTGGPVRENIQAAT